MKRLSIYLLFALGVVGAAPQAFAACTPTELKEGQVPGLHADTVGVKFGSRSMEPLVLDAITIENGTWTLTKAELKKISAFVATVPARQPIDMSQLKDTGIGGDSDKVTSEGGKLSVCLTPAAAGGAVANVSPPNSPLPTPATPSDCKEAERSWKPYGSSNFISKVLFNSAGVHCYSPPVVRTGDLLVVGMVLMPGETLPERVSAEFTSCPVEPTAPEVLANGELPELQSKVLELVERTAPTVAWLDARPCGGDAPVVTVKLGAGESATTTPYTVNQYKRYRATFHMGALYTDLHNPGFGLRDDNGTDVIFNTESEERGPEYVAALVVQGIFKYRPFNKTDPSDPRTWQYKGRDPIYDNDPLDRIGLVLTAGLKNPGDRFGVGLSYEIAYGVNIVGIYEFARVKQLRGFEVGDAFAGAADTIPTSKEWEKKFSLGLTFDLAFAGKLFSGAKSGG